MTFGEWDTCRDYVCDYGAVVGVGNVTWQMDDVFDGTVHGYKDKAVAGIKTIAMPLIRRFNKLLIRLLQFEASSTANRLMVIGSSQKW